MNPDCKEKKIDSKEGDVVEVGDWFDITDSTGENIDPGKAAAAAKAFFTEMANILKKGSDDLQKFKDQCK